MAGSFAFLYTWLAILALTAGIFEEVGRYIGYRWFMRREEKTWNKAVMYGLGHGGLESILLVGGLVGYMGVTGQHGYIVIGTATRIVLASGIRGYAGKGVTGILVLLAGPSVFGRL